MSTIIIQVEGGTAAAADPVHDDVYIIDWDKLKEDYIDYDTAATIIQEVMASSLDGPQQFEIIKRVVDKGLDDWA